jgi:hypothetical protein
MSTLWKTRRNIVCILFVSRSSSGIEKGLAGFAKSVTLLSVPRASGFRFSFRATVVVPVVTRLHAVPSHTSL